MRTSLNQLYPYLLAFCLILFLTGVGLVVWTILPKEWLDPLLIEAELQSWGILAPLAFILLRVVAILLTVIPNAPLDIAAGLLFGPFLGTLYSLIASALGALACFYLARILGRDGITRLLHRDLPLCDRLARRELGVIIFVARIEPIFSFSLVSFGAGLTPVSPGLFTLATVLGITPGTILLNYFGRSLFTGSLSLQIAFGLFAALLLLLVPWWLHRRQRLNTAKTDPVL